MKLRELKSLECWYNPQFGLNVLFWSPCILLLLGLLSFLLALPFIDTQQQKVLNKGNFEEIVIEEIQQQTCLLESLCESIEAQNWLIDEIREELVQQRNLNKQQESFDLDFSPPFSRKMLE